MIRHCGLEECSDLLMLATTEQLSAVFDLDLWRTDAVGHDEQFDSARFCQWLEVLADADVGEAAQRVAALDPTLVIVGLASQIAVFDPGVFAPATEMTGAEVVINPTLDGRLHAAIGGYIVAANETESWDTLVAVLTALEEHHRPQFDRLMRGCRRLSNSKPELDGLDDLLASGKQVHFDLAIGREQRRGDRGFVAAAQARAFLHASRTISLQAADPPQPDPIFVAFLRSLESTQLDAQAEPIESSATSLGDDESPADVGAVVELFRDAGVLPGASRRLLPGAPGEPATGIDRYLQFVREYDAVAYAARMQELAFLGNVLMSGCSLQDRPFTQAEASRAVLAVCSLGLENWPRSWLSKRAAAHPNDAAPLPEDILLRQDSVTAFGVGWSILHRDVSMFAAEQLLHALEDIQCSDRDVAIGLATLRRELTKHWQAATPWHARNAFDVLCILDLPVWAALLGLIAEFPVMLANVARHPTAVRSIDVSHGEFISGNDHLTSVRSFLRDLSGQLSGT